MTSKETIALRGVRVHNLKSVDLDIPLFKLIVVTGVSGSGKSSLAFDTLYAEGQRRFLESLSSYARQFLERMEKPDAESIEGIPPAVAIQQKASTKNPRSTVATVTEIHDYLRILYARAGVVHCVSCGKPLQRDTIDAMVETLLALPYGTRILIAFAWPRENGLAKLKTDGYHRAVSNGDVLPVEEAFSQNAGAVDILADKLAVDPAERERLADSLEAAMKRGGGRARVLVEDGREILFSDRLECRTCGISTEDPYPNLFSFNSPQGACSECSGFGDLAVVDPAKVVPDPSKSLADGAVEPWTKPLSRPFQRRLLKEAAGAGVPVDIPYRDLTPDQQRWVFEGGNGYRGVKGFFDRLQRKKYKVQVRVLLSRYRSYTPCPSCGGVRLNPEARAVRIGDLSIGDFLRLTVREAAAFLEKYESGLKDHERPVAGKLSTEIRNRLLFLLEVGLDYLTLDRMTFTLSGGEAQRINLAATLSASLVGTLFVLDEPSVGLHPRDNARLVGILNSLKDIGNTVVVVEHDPDIIRAAEYIIDLGPRAGEAGGRIVFAGPADRFLKDRSSITAAYIRGEKSIPVPDSRRQSRREIVVSGASKHNLKNIDVALPLGVFTCVTGVSGSGKSTLLYDVLYKGLTGTSDGGFREIRGREFLDKVLIVDQSPLGTSPRSIPATYTKAMDGIRSLFSRTREAKVMGFRPGYFSFNAAGGRCEPCEGAGRQVVEMQFLSDVVLTCEACKGKRFKDEILDIRYEGKNIDDVLSMTVTDALDFFADRKDIVRKLSPLAEVGLGYLKLGQPTTTLSGGELQRIKLAHHLVHEKGKRILYLFDEPTIGLHPDDVSVLLDCFHRLVDEGHTVAVIEHNLDVVKCADYVIDLGPEGGDKGGRVVAAGPPEEIVRSRRSITARYLKRYLS
ncbi:MAG: excinuclease ABC subunit UvrA [Acidobacteriota bacterium]|nr:excinuclease ABC subunit UvrA [Acidobacteriota bacterium]